MYLQGNKEKLTYFGVLRQETGNLDVRKNAILLCHLFL